MPKPLTSIVFAVLANVLLLAHSVIPHHHHGDRVCFEVRHSTSCEVAHTGECDGSHESEPPADQDGNCCALDQMVMFHPDGLRHDLEGAGKPAEFDFQKDFSPVLIPGSFSFSQFSFHLSFRQHPPELPYHDSCVTRVPGLRAPPIV